MEDYKMMINFLFTAYEIHKFYQYPVVFPINSKIHLNLVLSIIILEKKSKKIGNISIKMFDRLLSGYTHSSKHIY